MFESQLESEKRIKEFANIDKLEVAEVVLQEAKAQSTGHTHAGWLDDVARRTRGDLTADRGSKDSIITESRIMWSMAGTKVIEKEQDHSTSDVLEKQDDMERIGDRFTRKRLASRPDHLRPEMWKTIFRHAKLKEKQKWSEEKFRFENGRKL